jgi:hypothetical protein
MKISFYIFTWHNYIIFGIILICVFYLGAYILRLRYFANMIIERRVDKYGNKHGKLPAIVKPGVGGVFKKYGHNKNITSSNGGNE